MNNSSAMHFLGKAAWLLTALASIHVGAMALFQFDSMSYLPEAVVMPVCVVYLVAGIYSLVMLFMHSGCCE